MHIEIDREQLARGLELIVRVSTKHQTLPILQCVFIEVKKNIILKATNLELGMEVTLNVNTVTKTGTVAVPTQTLLQTVNLLSQKNITLKLQGEVLVVSSEGSVSQIKIYPKEEFPTIPQIDGKKQLIQKNLFILGIKTTAFAVSQSSIKPELGSVYIHQKKERSLTFVTTDSFRLAEKTVAQKEVVLPDSFLLPAKNALEIAHVCELAGEDPEMCVSENQLSLQFPEGIYITSRLTEGSFPDYTQIIPKEYVTHATLLKDDIIHALKKTNIFANKFLQIKTDVSPKDNSLTLTADGGEFGTTTESLKATVKGEELTLSFNQRYLGESLQYFTDESVILHFAGIGRPMVIEGASEKSFRYLVMPMNK